jgi:hypothetical protein
MTNSPEGEARAEHRSLARGLADVASQYGNSVVTAAGQATVAGAILGAVKIKDALTKKDGLPKPPGMES